MGSLLSSHSMTAHQLERCCVGGLSSAVIGYALHTADGRRVGTVEDILVDDEAFAVRFLVVNTSSAEFTLNQPYLLIVPNLCCWDTEAKSVRVLANAADVQAAPAYDDVSELAQSYEDVAIFHYGERPFAPADT